MKRLLVLAFFVSLLAGCARLAGDHRVVSVGFRHDPLDHGAEEAIEQIEIIAPSAAVHRVGRMPTDWRAGVSRQNGGSVTLGCDHEQFAVSDIHTFDRLVSLEVPNEQQPEVRVRVWVTRGPLGEGRIIALTENDLCLK